MKRWYWKKKKKRLDKSQVIKERIIRTLFVSIWRDIRDKSYKYLNLHDREGESEWMNLKKKRRKNPINSQLLRRSRLWFHYSSHSRPPIISFSRASFSTSRRTTWPHARAVEREGYTWPIVIGNIRNGPTFYWDRRVKPGRHLRHPSVK